ncbi:DUF2975 domain-containing protein [Legionella anisa]|uniref:DUF2975 domain-containing protein n=1 Tax=Legionella anisa TaxID=28082 RepID=A0AAX0WXY5_9GAMM|nr:DUF2975 domain-containing protein [Legionella anisa]AWN72783.1 DUF2975 domain-containing protein [Legionella anisa]KTC70776.1 hypothetical protein Lani_2323 [Legionella anisa]MBN5934745.1 DUF2975 domain-containing protein [Legionella anisa]MCW8423578.1 DUF2975 domain-containing protein [Legionella anisa]MCW8447098.1 DUF2975 domain-containing protein [Legionella anisa]
MKKIKNTSHILYLLFRILCWLIPLTTTLLILFEFDWMCYVGAWSSLISLEQIRDPSHFSWMHRFVVLVIEWMPLTITILICHKLAKLFRLFEKGDLFEKENIKLIKQVSIYMILGEIVQLFYQPLMTAALTFNNPKGERIASITLNSANLSTLITAFIILVASWIIQEAHQLKSETQLTI